MPADIGANDQRHAALRDLAAHMREHLRSALREYQPSDVSLHMGHTLATSAYTREALAYLLGVALVELEICTHRRRP
jgi:hypothetical protein